MLQYCSSVYFRVVLSIPEYFGIFQNIFAWFGVWNIPDCFRNNSGFFRIFWNTSEYFARCSSYLSSMAAISFSLAVCSSQIFLSVASRSSFDSYSGREVFIKCVLVQKSKKFICKCLTRADSLKCKQTFWAYYLQDQELFISANCLALSFCAIADRYEH